MIVAAASACSVMEFKSERAQLHVDGMMAYGHRRMSWSCSAAAR